MLLVGTWLAPTLAVRTDVSAEVQSAEVATGGVCPAECLECCSDPYFLGFGTSSKHFKCILKSKDVLPPGRKCEDAKARTYNLAQYKTHCEYTSEERSDEAHKDIKELGSCSKEVRCCCNAAEAYTEEVCLPLGTTGDTVTHQSEKSGKVETFALAPSQQFANRLKACQDPGNAPQTYQAAMKGAESTMGCCIETQETSSSERYRCGSRMVRMGKVTTSQPKYCNRQVKWTKCAKWESLWYCGGVEQKGVLYTRSSGTLGICVGDQSTPGSLQNAYGDRAAGAGPLEPLGGCPAGFTERPAGLRCKCNEAC